MRTSRVLIIAASEFTTAVGSKAFIISLVMLPIFMCGGIAVQAFTKNRLDISDRRFGVLDETRSFSAVFAAQATQQQATIYDANRVQRRPRFVPEPIAAASGDYEATELGLSERVRKGELFAFVRIPQEAATGDGSVPIRYYSNTPTYSELSEWIGRVVNDELRRRVVAESGIPAAVVQRLDRRLGVVSLGLAGVESGGKIRQAGVVNPIRTFVIPMIIMLLLFMTVMASAPQLLNAVLEEKQLRISEYLVSAVTSFELMAGKLLGCVGVAALLAGLYLGGGLAVAGYYGMLGQIPFGLLPWFFSFLILATLMYGSIFIAIGAACSDIKDAQSMMSPAMLLVVSPMFVWSIVLQEPNGALATGLSLFPVFAPVLMPLRIAVPPGPPVWHPFAAFALTLALTTAFVWAAGRVFRVGILAQGKGASFRDMLRWIRAD